MWLRTRLCSHLLPFCKLVYSRQPEAASKLYLGLSRYRTLVSRLQLSGCCGLSHSLQEASSTTSTSTKSRRR
ncbi:hypothetical protein JKP88DRAFT_13256 [Tribonema minus]|uniref:Uncharacterized protein n=1 Tax=Tribonema minus TaxID=303371 RepID=A0A835ZAL7_9STRA|nr:hypothetical protein JKP88DRAFT_13256 [Tribonema minus]